MNNVLLSGRLTKAPETRYSGEDGSLAISSFTIAVNGILGGRSMNKQRRKQLEGVISKIEEAKEVLENLKDEEEDYRDNFPENLVTSEKYEKAETAVFCMEEAAQALEDATDQINEAIEG